MMFRFPLLLLTFCLSPSMWIVHAEKLQSSAPVNEYVRDDPLKNAEFKSSVRDEDPSPRSLAFEFEIPFLSGNSDDDKLFKFSSDSRVDVNVPHLLPKSHLKNIADTMSNIVTDIQHRVSDFKNIFNSDSVAKLLSGKGTPSDFASVINPEKFFNPSILIQNLGMNSLKQNRLFDDIQKTGEASLMKFMGGSDRENFPSLSSLIGNDEKNNEITNALKNGMLTLTKNDKRNSNHENFDVLFKKYGTSDNKDNNPKSNLLMNKLSSFNRKPEDLILSNKEFLEDGLKALKNSNGALSMDKTSKNFVRSNNQSKNERGLSKYTSKSQSLQEIENSNNLKTHSSKLRELISGQSKPELENSYSNIPINFAELKKMRENPISQLHSLQSQNDLSISNRYDMLEKYPRNGFLFRSPTSRHIQNGGIENKDTSESNEIEEDARLQSIALKVDGKELDHLTFNPVSSSSSEHDMPEKKPRNDFLFRSRMHRPEGMENQDTSESVESEEYDFSGSMTFRTDGTELDDFKIEEEGSFLRSDEDSYETLFKPAKREQNAEMANRLRPISQQKNVTSFSKENSETRKEARKQQLFFNSAENKIEENQNGRQSVTVNGLLKEQRQGLRTADEGIGNKTDIMLEVHIPMKRKVVLTETRDIPQTSEESKLSVRKDVKIKANNEDFKHTLNKSTSNKSEDIKSSSKEESVVEIDFHVSPIETRQVLHPSQADLKPEVIDFSEKDISGEERENYFIEIKNFKAPLEIREQMHPPRTNPELDNKVLADKRFFGKEIGGSVNEEYSVGRNKPQLEIRKEGNPSPHTNPKMGIEFIPLDSISERSKEKLPELKHHKPHYEVRDESDHPPHAESKIEGVTFQLNGDSEKNKENFHGLQYHRSHFETREESPRTEPKTKVKALPIRGFSEEKIINSFTILEHPKPILEIQEETPLPLDTESVTGNDNSIYSDTQLQTEEFHGDKELDQVLRQIIDYASQLLSMKERKQAPGLFHQMESILHIFESKVTSLKSGSQSLKPVMFYDEMLFCCGKNALNGQTKEEIRILNTCIDKLKLHLQNIHKNHSLNIKTARVGESP